MMRFNPNRFSHIGVFLALLAGGLGIGVLIGNGPSKSTRDKHADKMIRYKKARLSETKDRLRTETRIAENGLAHGEKVSKPTAADNGRSGDGEQAEQDEKNIESVLSEIISYVEEEASPRKAGLLAELRYARDSGNVKMISNLLRRVALFNRNSKSGLAARNALGGGICWPSKSAALSVKSSTVSLRLPGLPSAMLSASAFFLRPAPMRAPPCPFAMISPP